MAASLGRHLNQTQMERGTVWE